MLITIASSFRSISTFSIPIRLDFVNSWWLFRLAKFPSLNIGLSLYNFFPCGDWNILFSSMNAGLKGSYSLRYLCFFSFFFLYGHSGHFYVV